MIVALVDNGSLEPAAHLHLRRVASSLAERTATTIHAVSWKHSDAVPAAALDGVPAWTLGPWLRAMRARGAEDFLFVPFFLSAQGAVGTALRHDLEHLRTATGGFSAAFTDGITARGAVPAIAVERIQEVITREGLDLPAVLVVDHGGPSPASAALRDRLAREIAAALPAGHAEVLVASMEGRHPPLLADTLRRPDLADRDVVVLPLFLSPGRHAGPDGDIARACRASAARCHVAGLIGTHDRAVEALAGALLPHLSRRNLPSFV